jgi:hypothetical protein
MITALTMIRASPGREKTLYDRLSGMDGIKDVYRLFGEYDLFVIMQADGTKRLSILADIVRHLGEVEETSPLMVARDMAKPGDGLEKQGRGRETAYG